MSLHVCTEFTRNCLFGIKQQLKESRGPEERTTALGRWGAKPGRHRGWTAVLLRRRRACAPPATVRQSGRFQRPAEGEWDYGLYSSTRAAIAARRNGTPAQGRWGPAAGR